MADKTPEPDKGQQVQAVMVEFEKTMKVFQMYEDNHPSTKKAVDRFYDKFSRYLDDNGNLILRVSQFELFFDEALVYQNLERNTSLAFRLFRDGLRGIGFQRGMTTDELLEVMKLFNFDFGESDEDDMVTKLWELNLPHFQYWEAEEELKPPEQVEIKQFEETAQVARSDDEKPPDSEMPLEELMLKPEEISELKREIELVEKEGMSVDLVEIIEHILKTSTDAAVKNRLVEGAPGLVFNLLTRSNFAALNHLLLILANIDQYLGEVDTKIKKLILNTFARLETDFVIANLAEELEKGNPEIETFLGFLSKAIVEGLFRLLLTLGKTPGRQIVIRCLARLTADDRTPVLKRLQDKDPVGVYLAIQILEAIGDQPSAQSLKAVLLRPERELRRFLVETVSTLPGEGRREILLQAVEDPEFDIRLLALRQMAETADGYYVDPIMKLMLRKDFKRREVEERRAFYYTLADCGQRRVLDFIRRALKRWELFPSKPTWERRQIAAFALSRIDDPEARKVLEDGLRSGNRRLRELCTKALVLTRKKDE